MRKTTEARGGIFYALGWDLTLSSGTDEILRTSLQGSSRSLMCSKMALFLFAGVLSVGRALRVLWRLLGCLTSRPPVHGLYKDHLSFLEGAFVTPSSSASRSSLTCAHVKLSSTLTPPVFGLEQLVSQSDSTSRIKTI